MTGWPAAGRGRVGVVVVVWFLCAAIVAGVLGHELLLALVILALCARAALARTPAAWAWCALAALCGLIGAGAAARVRGDQAHVARVVTAQGRAPLALTGQVVSFPASSPYGTSFLFGTTVGGRRVRLALRAGFFDVDYGDRFTCRARVTPGVGDDYLASRGAAGTARVKLRDVEFLPERGARGFLRAGLWSLHRAARTRLSRALARDAALPIGLMLGERGYLDRTLRDAVIELGIAHLLALSGMHLGVVAMAAVVLAGRLRRGRDLAVLLALTLYIGVVGDVESLWRAYLMAVLLIAARALLRPVRPVDALGKALLLMLLVAPASIRSIGLQLSFAATLAVLVALERLPFLRARPSAGARGVRGAAGRIGRAAVAAMVVSVVVEIVILPLQFHHFGRMSAVGPLATVLFFVPVTAVQVLAMAAAVVAGVPWVGGGVLACLSAASRATEAAVLAAAAYAPEPLAGTGPHAILYYGALLVVWRWPRPRRARLLAAALLAASFRAGPDFW